jgi:hypothetical protein
MKALEYGYSTREMELKYSCSKHKENWNKLEGFGDANFELPRSQAGMQACYDEQGCN